MSDRTPQNTEKADIEVSVSIKAQNPDLETAWRTIAWWEQTCSYWHAEAQRGYALRDSLSYPPDRSDR